jgi:hypothetical protein
MMHIPIRHIVATIAVASLPWIVQAQTANAPGGQASTGTPLDQTTSPQTAAPKTTKTAPSTTNPTGSTSATDASSTAKTPKTRRSMKANDNPPGDVPTYPAPAPNGAPTK